MQQADYGLGQRELHQRFFDDASDRDLMLSKDFFDRHPVTLKAPGDYADLIERYVVIADQAQDFLCHRADFVVNAESVEDPAAPVYRRRLIQSLRVFVKETEDQRQII